MEEDEVALLDWCSQRPEGARRSSALYPVEHRVEMFTAKPGLAFMDSPTLDG